MLKKIKVFVLGILAGASIGLGGLLFTIATSQGNKLLGSALFSIGLLIVCLFSLFLYTGKIGFFVGNDNKKVYSLDLLIGLIGNFVGALVFGYLCRLFFINNETILSAINTISSSRLIDLGNGGTPFYITFVGSIFCGCLVFIAVYGFKKDWHIFAKIFLLVFCVFAFVASGFEHCIANMFYISMANMWNLQNFLNILIVIIGNSLGAILLALSAKLINKEDKKEELN